MFGSDLPLSRVIAGSGVCGQGVVHVNVQRRSCGILSRPPWHCFHRRTVRARNRGAGTPPSHRDRRTRRGFRGCLSARVIPAHLSRSLSCGLRRRHVTDAVLFHIRDAFRIASMRYPMDSRRDCSGYETGRICRQRAPNEAGPRRAHDSSRGRNPPHRCAADLLRRGEARQ